MGVTLIFLAIAMSLLPAMGEAYAAGEFTPELRDYYSMKWLEDCDPFVEDCVIIPRTVKLPTTTKLDLCSTVGCQKRTGVRLDRADIEEAKSKFADVHDAKSELAAIAAAISYLELRTCLRVGVCNDRPGVGGPEVGQLDCVDEATNTTSYLLLLHLNSMFKYHRVTVPDSMGWHWFARIVDRKGKCVRVETDFNRPGDKPKFYACS